MCQRNKCGRTKEACKQTVNYTEIKTRTTLLGTLTSKTLLKTESIVGRRSKRKEYIMGCYDTNWEGRKIEQIAKNLDSDMYADEYTILLQQKNQGLSIIDIAMEKM